MVVTIDSTVNKKVLEALVATINANGTNSSVPATIEFVAECHWRFGAVFVQLEFR